MKSTAKNILWMLSIVTIGQRIQTKQIPSRLSQTNWTLSVTSKFQQKFGYYEFPNSETPGPRFLKKERQVLNQGRKEGDHSLNSQWNSPKDGDECTILNKGSHYASWTNIG